MHAFPHGLDPKLSAAVLQTSHRNRLKPPFKLWPRTAIPSQIGCPRTEGGHRARSRPHSVQTAAQGSKKASAMVKRTSAYQPGRVLCCKGTTVRKVFFGELLALLL